MKFNNKFYNNIDVELKPGNCIFSANHWKSIHFIIGDPAFVIRICRVGGKKRLDIRSNWHENIFAHTNEDIVL